VLSDKCAYVAERCVFKTKRIDARMHFFKAVATQDVSMFTQVLVYERLSS
jgi:hypothetical protein